MILILTSLPGNCFSHNGFSAMPGLDKVVHFAMFATFAFVSLWGYRSTLAAGGKNRLAKAASLMLTIGILYGALTELMQHFWIEGRTGSPFDLIADATGTAVGTIIYVHYQKKHDKKIEN